VVRSRTFIHMRLLYAALVMAAIAAIGFFYLFTGRLNLNMWYPPKGITVSHPYEYKNLRTPAPEKFHELATTTIHSPAPLSKYFHEPRHWAPFNPQVYTAKRMVLNPVVTVTPVPAPEYQPYTPPPAMHTPPPIVPPDYSGAVGTFGSAPKPDDKKSPRPLDSPTP
jgi:hypothetical protein